MERPPGPSSVEGLIAGCLLGALVWARIPDKPPATLIDLVRRESARPDPRTMGVRQWRALPRIGSRRAWAIQARYWNAQSSPNPVPVDLWRTVEGIGPKTEAAIEAWLAGRRPQGVHSAR